MAMWAPPALPSRTAIWVASVFLLVSAASVTGAVTAHTKRTAEKRRRIRDQVHLIMRLRGTARGCLNWVAQPLSPKPTQSRSRGTNSRRFLAHERPGILLKPAAIARVSVKLDPAAPRHRAIEGESRGT